jgi:hypothetical protein
MITFTSNALIEESIEEVIHLSIPPTMKVTLYRSMYEYGNYIHMKSDETNLFTMDHGVAFVFGTICHLSVNDKNPFTQRSNL